MLSVALHTRLYRLRPEPARLTGFYLAMSTGGALGGVFAGLVAPVLFDWTWEYPILILAAGALVPQLFLTHGLRDLWSRPGARIAAVLVALLVLAALAVVTGLSPESIAGTRYTLAFTLIAGIGLVTIGARVPYLLVLFTSLLLFGGIQSLKLSLQSDARLRSYFGIYTVYDYPSRRMLVHGSNCVVRRRGSGRRRPITTKSGVGRVLREAPLLFGPAARIGVVGLGTGTLGCYRTPGQRWRFYEIDPAMARIARDRVQLPVAVPAVSGHRHRRRATVAGTSGARLARRARARRFLLGRGADAPADARGVRGLRADAPAEWRAGGPHLEPLHRPSPPSSPPRARAGGKR
ncbi:hypothetical protein AB5I41_06680 [Sphingomonas sp. MMS24-JH45]